MNEDIFQREKLLIGESGYFKLQNAKVAVFGCGGVGSYTVEALARAGIGEIAVIDGDCVSESNINRQLAALKSTVGRKKASVMADRIRDINPDIKVSVFEEYYTEENNGFIDLKSYDFVVDAVDMVSAKLLLAEKTATEGIKIISSMGAGNRLDPTRFRVTDIYKTEVCPLAKVMRYELRKRGIKKLPVVFSDEIPLKTGEKTIGSISFVPSCAGLIAAGYVIRTILGETK